MKRWVSKEEIATSYNLDHSLSHEELRAKLKMLAKAIHPDGTGGDFESDEQRRKFSELSAALDFLEMRPVVQGDIGALIRIVEQQNALIQEQAEQRRIEGSKEKSDRAVGLLRDEAEKAITQQVQDRYRPILLTSGAFAALGVFVVAVGEPIALAVEAVSGIDSPFVQAISALVGVAGATFGLFAYFAEGRAKRAHVLILTEEAFELFVGGNEFYDKLRYDHDSGDYSRRIISVREISEALHAFEPKLDLEVCDEVARVIAERMVNRRLAEFSEKPTISPTLVLNANFVDEVGTQYYLRNNRKENFGDASEEIPF